MQYIVLFIFIWFLIKSISYSIYEIKQNSNKIGGTACLIISVLSFIIATVALFSAYGQALLGETSFL